MMEISLLGFLEFLFRSMILSFGISALYLCSFVTRLCLRVSAFQNTGCCSQQAAADLQQSPAGTFRPLPSQSVLQLSRKENVSLKHQRKQCFLNAFKQAVWAGFFCYLLRKFMCQANGVALTQLVWVQKWNVLKRNKMLFGLMFAIVLHVFWSLGP